MAVKTGIALSFFAWVWCLVGNLLMALFPFMPVFWSLVLGLVAVVLAAGVASRVASV
jgi:hypothetical protein